VHALLADTSHLILHNYPIAKLTALLSVVSLFIGNDSGISHLAAALGVPTLAIFGPTDPAIWAPCGKQAFWLQGKAPCAPCKSTTLLACDDQQCLASIQVEDVMAFLVEKNIGKRAVDATKRKQVYPQQQGEEGMALVPPA
jgi:ADP-heptose:LPS heptosyltransferase